ncbi:copper radical oxidase [Gloeophyllum trabeum ATCC 11539]|uniref:Copper radical oxidase n=1 Tax=Gloeophyllum trabeum (strain ATCC 11539 / FP-39264 / Madison 617) TaxID=670483 RepID=S7QFR6_GLOTA|nr:copper radical oxidase [Gloeophyllum trabeum ATCC 11539]EPQ57993.1 copper radical oxidase [Gloeophyllum trabeum ATCC 11539]
MVRGISCVFLLALNILSVGGSKHSAWNGHTTPGSTTPSDFTPYYVAPGTKSYDSSSPFVHYSGNWKESFSPAYVHNTVRSTSHPKAAVTFTFTGTGVEWFGNMDDSHGIADVYIDGEKVQTVDNYSEAPMKQQRLFWKYDLPFGRHHLKVVNTGKRRGSQKKGILDVDAFVVTYGTKAIRGHSASSIHSLPTSDSRKAADLAEATTADAWSLEQKGSTGVHAMQLSIISPTHAIIVDKVEHNPLTVSGHPAWAALYNLNTHAIKPLNVQSNSFCAGGTFLSNGTLINVGGNPVVEDHTSAADFGDADGLQAIRIFEPCESSTGDACEIYEDHARIRMASPRWYNTVIRLQDGSAMIIGGAKKGGWINNATVNNPTVEYWPPKSIHGSNGMPVHMQFLVDTLNSNLFPIAFLLPDGKVFMAANQDAMIYDWQNNQERRLPQIPNGVRVTYPMAGTGLLLPLSPDNGYTPEVLLCGGSTVDDRKPGYEISSQDPASAQCVRMVLTDAGISAGWQVEQMPQARTMPDAVLLPTGDVLIVNGAGTGISGYGNVVHQVGASNADNPAFTPVLYRPGASNGQRFSSAGLPTSDIPRLYHSVATLTPNGDIMIAGSNPNLDRSEVEYGTEYRVEWLKPPYMLVGRPEWVSAAPRLLGYGQSLHMEVKLQQNAAHSPDIRVALMDLGYITHAVHANSRLVYLAASLSVDDRKTLTITAPPNANVYPPGPGWLYLVVDGIPTTGLRVLVGDGKGPAVDEKAMESMLSKTIVDQYDKGKEEKGDGAE